MNILGIGYWRSDPIPNPKFIRGTTNKFDQKLNFETKFDKFFLETAI